MLDKDLVNELKRFAVDPTIIDKLDNHVPLNDLDSLKLIQQLYNVGYQAIRAEWSFLIRLEYLATLSLVKDVQTSF